MSAIQRHAFVKIGFLDADMEEHFISAVRARRMLPLAGKVVGTDCPIYRPEEAQGSLLADRRFRLEHAEVTPDLIDHELSDLAVT